MAKRGLAKVTITGYYWISDSELDTYEVDEFNLDKMVAIDQDNLDEGRVDVASVVEWMKEEPSVVIEPVVGSVEDF